jgi:hypothetical protein
MTTKNRILSALGVLSLIAIAWCVIFIQSDNVSTDVPHGAPAVVMSETEAPQSKPMVKKATSNIVSMTADFTFVDSNLTAPESAQPQQ